MSVTRAHAWRDRWADVRRSFLDFLAVPTLTVIAFVLLAVVTYLMDRQPVGWLEPTRHFLREHFIDEAGKTESLLGTIAGSLVTLTSITFSLLLLAVQQSAAALTTQVLDQFVRRRDNQVYFGVFVGASVYALLILSANSTQVTPVFGASVALLVAIGALLSLVLLLYSTLNQMRPIRIVEAIHDLTLVARAGQLPLIARTMREPAFHDAPVVLPVRAEDDGHLTLIRLQRIAEALDGASGRCEVVIRPSLGEYVCYHEALAEVRATSREDAERVAVATRSALRLERQRDFRHDAAYGIDQLATIAWVSISTAKSNPAPALAALRNLRDLAARWSEPQHTPDASAPPLPVAYRDTVLTDLIGTFESTAVVTSESMQHQSLAEVVRSFADLLRWLPSDLQPRLDDAIRRIPTAIGDHVLTAELQDALLALCDALLEVGRPDTERLIRRSLDRMADLIGSYESRGSRGRSRD
ncbi:MAG TPA: DUF2254 family protein [Gemmatimonadaceae bacterium]|nr:DUF2254 family protein [Gemmatimonadaceae bacterium]